MAAFKFHFSHRPAIKTKLEAVPVLTSHDILRWCTSASSHNDSTCHEEEKEGGVGLRLYLAESTNTHFSLHSCEQNPSTAFRKRTYCNTIKQSIKSVGGGCVLGWERKKVNSNEIPNFTSYILNILRHKRRIVSHRQLPISHRNQLVL